MEVAEEPATIGCSDDLQSTPAYSDEDLPNQRVKVELASEKREIEY